ncbi:hypothetical protein D1BOALGB6SA_2327 [Olavius sp. associated proteobacterium Delta 1]|nr:hypothetical protein D1BOALGB6SA_2327 [Olavius sp. associated proteobacterium Delta 1]
MQLLDAAIAFALTIAGLATVVSIIIDMKSMKRPFQIILNDGRSCYHL